MDKPRVDYEKMRIRLEFLYRSMNLSKVLMTSIMRLPVHEQERVISVMASGAFQVLYLYRIDGQLHDTPEERKCAEIIARVIAEDFMRISAVIEAECVGVPPDQMAIRYDGILQHGIDRTITTVKELIEGKEVANG